MSTLEPTVKQRVSSLSLVLVPYNGVMAKDTQVTVSKLLEYAFDVMYYHYSADPFNLFGQKVKSIYLKQPDIPQDDWPPVRKSQYINLALLKSAAMKDDQYSRFTVRGSVDDILKDKDELLFDDVFVDADMGHRILFEGRPGSGKTTLMHRISKKWGKRTNPQANNCVHSYTVASIY